MNHGRANSQRLVYDELKVEHAASLGSTVSVCRHTTLFLFDLLMWSSCLRIRSFVSTWLLGETTSAATNGKHRCVEITNLVISSL